MTLKESGKISIHAPREGCDRLLHFCAACSSISIHAPREGCDSTPYVCYLTLTIFQSTHPARGATLINQSPSICFQFQSTHPARGATERFARRMWTSEISIHAPREGCDNSYKSAVLNCVYFNPRTPRGVRLYRRMEQISNSFYFNPRTPRGVRQGRCGSSYLVLVISIHAPREGCDKCA